MKVGLLEGVVSTIAESDAQIGGTFITTNPTVANIGDTDLVIESVVGFETEGAVIINGQFYAYSGITPGPGLNSTLNNLTPALLELVPEDSYVANAGRSRSALDQLRRAMSVNYAEDEDLSVVGRNLGVLRDPFIGDNERFRKIIKALAFNPRGTVYGLEMALDALVGVGNYEIIENLINEPAKVKINIKGDAAIEASLNLEGKGYLNEVSDRVLPLTTTSVPAPAYAVSVQSVNVAPYRSGWQKFSTPFGVGLRPSDASFRYNNAPLPDAPMWTWNGQTETTVVPFSGGFPQLVNTAGAESYYERLIPQMAISNTITTIKMRIQISGQVSNQTGSGTGRQFFIQLADGARKQNLVVASLTAGQTGLGYVNSAGNSLVFATTQQPTANYANRWIDLRITKQGNTVRYYAKDSIFGPTEIQIGAGSGQVDATLQPGIRFGFSSTGVVGSTLAVKVEGVEITTTTTREFAAVLSTSASTDAASPQKITNGTSIFQVTDAGKYLQVTSFNNYNAYGGDVFGEYQIDTVLSATEATVKGIQHPLGATVDGAHPTWLRITKPDQGLLFQYPDDLGKTVTITDSVNGNNGDYIITKLLDDDGNDLNLGLTANYIFCLSKTAVLSAPMVPEGGMTWALKPVFDTDTFFGFQLAGVVEGVGTSRTIRQALPSTNVPITVTTTNALAGQVLKDNTVETHRIDEDTLDRYALYIPDPFAYLYTYLDGLVAAGIVSEINVI